MRRGDDEAARARAARAYADLSRDDLGKILGWSKGTISRIEAGARTLRGDDRVRYGEACGVPRWFMETGWTIPESAERLSTDAALTSVRLELLQIKTQMTEAQATGLQGLSALLHRANHEDELRAGVRALEDALRHAGRQVDAARESSEQTRREPASTDRAGGDVAP